MTLPIELPDPFRSSAVSTLHAMPSIDSQISRPEQTSNARSYDLVAINYAPPKKKALEFAFTTGHDCVRLVLLGVMAFVRPYSQKVFECGQSFLPSPGACTTHKKRARISKLEIDADGEGDRVKRVRGREDGDAGSSMPLSRGNFETHEVCKGRWRASSRKRTMTA